MIPNEPVSRVRNVLASLYFTQNDAIRVLDDAGIPKESVDFNGSALNFWHAILAESGLYPGKTETLFGIALNEFPGNQDLEHAIQGFRRFHIGTHSTDTAIPTPVIPVVDTMPAELPPFIAGPPITHPSRFFGRRLATRRMLGLWKQPPLQNAAIIGPKRSGKTSLLFYLMSITSTNGQYLRSDQQNHGLSVSERTKWIYIDFQDPRLGTRFGFMRYFVSCLRLPAPQSWTLDRFMETIQFNLNMPTIVLLDEIGVALNRYSELDDEFWEGLRSLASTQLNGKLGFVLSSHVSPVDVAHDTGHSSPFFNIFGYVRNLGPLSEQEAQDFVASSPIEFSVDDTEWILQHSKGWPVLLQILCRERLASLSDGEDHESWRDDALDQIRNMPDVYQLYSK